jgi:hypothetical protein
MTFSTAAGNDLQANENFQFDLSFWTGLTSYISSSACRCFVLDSQGNMDFNWKDLTFSSISSMTVSPSVKLSSS